MQNVQAVQLRTPSRSAPPPKIRGGHSSITSMGSPFLWRGTVSQCPPPGSGPGPQTRLPRQRELPHSLFQQRARVLVIRLASSNNANHQIRFSNNAHEFESSDSSPPTARTTRFVFLTTRTSLSHQTRLLQQREPPDSFF